MLCHQATISRSVSSLPDEIRQLEQLWEHMRPAIVDARVAISDDHASEVTMLADRAETLTRLISGIVEAKQPSAFRPAGRRTVVDLAKECASLADRLRGQLALVVREMSPGLGGYSADAAPLSALLEQADRLTIAAQQVVICESGSLVPRKAQAPV